MQAQMTDQEMPVFTPAPKKNSSWLKSALYLVAILVLAAAGYYSYTHGWFKTAGDKVSGLFASKQVESPATEAAATAVEAAKPAPVAEEEFSKARTAFAAGDVNAAIQAYNEIITKNPDDVGARGELGNVFYTVGMMREAAQAYFDAASKAVDQKQFEVAEALLPAIIDGNPMLATQLSDKLFDAQVREDMARNPMPAQPKFEPYQSQQYQQQPQQYQQQAQPSQPMQPQSQPYQPMQRY